MSLSRSMEGSSEDLGAPDSWEVADIDERMTRLRVSSKNVPTPELPDELPPLPASSASGYSSSKPAERVVGLSEDAVSQVDQFLREALEKPRERLSILRMEQDVEKFILDPTKQQLEFQALPTSYLRLAAHRVAQHYNLQSIALPDDNLPDGTGSRIVLCKTSECHFPPIRLADIPVCLPQDTNNEIVKVAIKQRPQKRSQIMGSANTHSSKTNHPKTVEERKEEYNRARARIFRGNSSATSGGKSESEPTLPYEFQYCSLPARSEEKFAVEESEINLNRGLYDSSAGSSSLGRDRIEKEHAVNRYKTSNRVAIFRDREVDRKDPDYDRSYDRYMQRFDPGFGFNGGPYTMQPMYSPAINYNTEFPQLGPGHRPHISYGPQHQPIPQHVQGPWAATSAPTALCYGPPEGLMAQFNPNHIGGHSTSSMYLHSSQYGAPPRSGMAFVHPHEHVQTSAQTQRQSESNFGLARPR